ncbi:AAA family ATPase [[Kitasatospora] papulosa]|uniref:AAA family ATPase n=1 Tax=Streptomyces TaxID=1883 RepID=UPI0004C61835|nr:MULTISPECIES: AAA family ATPase [Streptomyces]MCY1652820.1 AAA family ATPase [Streptomyces sp. SL203]MCY1679961.1 AAA family ATPase [Streptomyces sp. SL294]WSZ49309.1 AAA family ATPase [[Kitasatospora] papulosa]
MRFIVQTDRRIPSDTGPRAAILLPDNWDDFGFRTSYDLWFRRTDGTRPIEIGRVKIAIPEQQPGPSPLPPGDFAEGLPAGLGEWVSLGQDGEYYERIAELEQQGREILRSLGDITALESAHLTERKLNALARSSPVFDISFMRNLSSRTLLHQYRRITAGGPKHAGYKFSYHFPERNTEISARPPLEFEVRPNSVPSNNIHVLIGRNGVGKTTLLRSLATAAVRPFDLPETAGKITYIEETGFANVLLVTFSAFDPFASINASHTKTRYIHVGLTHVPDGETCDSDPASLKGKEELVEEFLDSLKSIATSGHYDRWFDSLHTLASDPQFDAAIFLGGNLSGDRLNSRLIEGVTHEDEPANIAGRSWREIFMNLSSGHAIVLLTLTRLVDLVGEQTLVLFDEPEAHLHPPLLSSFVRSLSELLAERNGVAIIATHSPVVLQEVPKSCVYKISRPGGRARRPKIETYGENVGVLTHEIFGLEVMKSGFYAAIEKAVARFDTYEDVIGHFGNQLGDEAKGLVRILFADKREDVN